jgi:hypothetical protein
MAANKCLATHYVLVVRKPDGEKLTGTGTPGDLTHAHNLAVSILRLLPKADFVDIHLFVPSQQLGEPKETVHRKAISA